MLCSKTTITLRIGRTAIYFFVTITPQPFLRKLAGKFVYLYI
jgi:hypothetical protein